MNVLRGMVSLLLQVDIEKVDGHQDKFSKMPPLPVFHNIREMIPMIPIHNLPETVNMYQEKAGIKGVNEIQVKNLPW